MNLLTGLFRAARKMLMTTDNDMGMFRTKLDELVAAKDTLSDEDVVSKVEELKSFTTDLPDSEDKSKLDRFLEDFKAIKEQDAEAAKKAADMVSDLFEKLDTEAMKDVPNVSEETTETVEETEAPLTEGAAPEVTEETEKAVEETVAPEGEEAKDAESPFNEYTLEEIYQYCKKRKAEEEGEATDGCAKDGAEETEKVEEEEEEEKEVTTDHAPRIPVTMNGTPAAGSLGEMFNNIKNGGR